MSDIPLGKPTHYPLTYAPEVLCAVPRQAARRTLGLTTELPFAGEDLWNAWELSWLNEDGRPMVAVANIRVPASSEYIIESKSLKLYLSSFAQHGCPSASWLERRIAEDLGGIVAAEVQVGLDSDPASAAYAIAELPGHCIDHVGTGFATDHVDPDRLVRYDDDVREDLHSHLLRSLCPVTAQPDAGSILIRYRGPRMDRVGLLRYLVSYRQHSDFHEACVERIFVDLKERCRPLQLTVYARYNRRGGIDINPFRSDFEAHAANHRVWRQ